MLEDDEFDQVPGARTPAAGLVTSVRRRARRLLTAGLVRSVAVAVACAALAMAATIGVARLGRSIGGAEPRPAASAAEPRPSTDGDRTAAPVFDLSESG